MTNYDINALAKNIGVQLPREDFRHPEIKHGRRQIGAVLLQSDGYYYRIEEFSFDHSPDWDSCEELTVEETIKFYSDYLKA